MSNAKTVREDRPLTVSLAPLMRQWAKAITRKKENIKKEVRRESPRV